ncbi:MAG: PsiF family protein [Rhodoplanes sp.]|jgi:Ni/Co efflux regulator RcnB|nr:PsiF family protein [Rhodoplanes sp.]
MTRFFVAAIAIAFLAATPAAPGMAQTGETAAKQEKKISAQQQKMKDCASKWKEEKATKNVKGREAYRKFMSGCLKG